MGSGGGQTGSAGGGCRGAGAVRVRRGAVPGAGVRTLDTASVGLLCTRCLTKQIAYLCSGLRFQGLVFSPQMIASRENHRQLGGVPLWNEAQRGLLPTHKDAPPTRQVTTSRDPCPLCFGVLHLSGVAHSSN